MDISKLSKEEKAAIKAQLEAEERNEKERVARERENYKQLEDVTVREEVKELMKLSSLMMEAKDRVFKAIGAVTDMQEELFKVRINRKSRTYNTMDGSMKITLGVRTNDGWDDTAQVGVEKVMAYLRTMAKDENSADLVDTVMGLLSKDKKGNMKLSSILQLERKADKSHDPEFIDGIRIIKDAYRPVDTCAFIEASMRDENGKERGIPLSMSAINLE
ncbi:DUF3164 family protein [Bacteroides sp.]|uniref:DUF3164 family protein n=1 Tax=Bacteroides sp. TaxID=29523 RepID=UPI00262DBCC0|nr:DUF3164 family protein [Bacteroides sp.]MDD3040919.1 DUF3164 family protein [Bacteroides sp.]